MITYKCFVIVVFMVLLSLTPIWARDLSLEQFLAPANLTDFIMTETQAIGLLPPELVCEPYVQELQWSPDGRFLLIQRRDYHVSPNQIKEFLEQGVNNDSIPSEISMEIWDCKKSRLKSFWQGKSQENILETHWLAGSDAFIVIVSTVLPSDSKTSSDFPITTYSVICAEAPTGRLQIDQSVNYPILRLSPTSALAIISIILPPENAKNSNITYLLNDKLATRKVIPMSPITQLQDVRWSEDGQKPYLNLQALSGDPNSPTLTFNWYGLNPNSLELTKEEKEPAIGQLIPIKASWFRIIEKATPLGSTKDSPRINTNWLAGPSGEKTPLPALICTDGNKCLLSPAQNAVCYTSEGAAFVRRFVVLSVEQVKAARDQVLKEKLKNNAKNIGLGLMMYSSDYDGDLPSSADDIKQILAPYVRNNAETLDGFVFIPPSSKLADIEFPADTPLGYIPGLNGFAIVYADSHVTWQTELPKKLSE